MTQKENWFIAATSLLSVLEEKIWFGISFLGTYFVFRAINRSNVNITQYNNKRDDIFYDFYF